MIDSDALRDAAVTALQAAGTLAGENVFSPRDWPTWNQQYPLLIVRTPEERAEAVAPRTWPPQFTTVVTLQVEAQLDATSESAADANIRLLTDQVKAALLQNGQFIFNAEIQAFPSWRVRLAVNEADRRHIGQAEISLDVELYQVYEPTIDAAGNSLVTPPALTEIHLDTDLVNVFDPAGTYTDSDFPNSAEPAPRASGPDGRVEAGADIVLPQT
ncbi:MAG: hypothetical protein M0006_02310 [Magnetospirillum sp.]|nr:hypothetical protein [Magnetospirillum sp.]